VRRSARHARFTQLPIRRLTPPAARGKARPKVLLRCAAVVPMPEVLPVSLRRFRPFGAPRILWGSLTSEPSRVCLTRSRPTISRVASLPPSPLERRTTSSSQLECSSGPFATRRGLWLTRTCIPRILQVGPRPDGRRALLLVASRDGCSEAIVLAHGIRVELMVAPLRAGLAK
jgi:hypothetical protein